MHYAPLLGARWIVAVATAVSAAFLAFAPPALRAEKPDTKSNNGKGSGGASSPTTAITTYSGQATALRIDDVQVPVPGPIIVCDTGELPAAGGALDKSDTNVNLANGAIRMTMATATTTGDGPQAASESSLSDLRLEIITPSNGTVIIESSYIAAAVTAFVEQGGKSGVTANVTVQGLKVNGEAVNVTGQPNQIVTIPGGKIVIDERANAASSTSSADIALKALHVYIDGCMNGAAGIVHAGISGSGNVPPPAAGECGKLTGGGFIVSETGVKSTFAVSGGVRRGEFWGHLNFIDHATGMQVKSTAVTDFKPNPNVPDCRVITYNVTIDGVAGTATIDAWDRGEPGRDDYFAIRLSNGYNARGTLGGEGSGGGNLQLHKCPPGWE